MAITKEQALQFADKPAITCCRFEAGSVIEPSVLEDPAIFPDLEETGLLTIGEDCLTIGEVLGAKLTRTLDALMPITREDVEELAAPSEKSEDTMEVTGRQRILSSESVQKNHLLIRIGEGKDIELSIPLNLAAGAGMIPDEGTAGSEEEKEEVLRRLTRRYIPIREVKRGCETKIEGTTLYIREGIEREATDREDLVVDLKLDIITRENYGIHSETIMDVQPIAVKEEGELGTGLTRVLDGVVMMVTGTDEAGVQIGEFGSSEGPMDRNVMWNRPGAPDQGDILIRTQVTIKEHMNMERPGPLAAHKASDYITEEIRRALKAADASLVEREEVFAQKKAPGRKKVLLVKEIMGQGAMHDNLILPVEPVGTLGAKPNVDLGNLPVMLSPLEVLDGGIHALTCIGPASKETSRHYFREPLVLEALQDEDVNVCGVLFVGSPQINSEKFYVSKRLGMTVEAIDPDGVIITTEGFGNNHIDFAAHHEEVGKRGYPVVGMSFCAVQGALVVGNEYMTHMIDNNKSEQGIENEILSNNTLCEEDAVRALAMLKAAMAGEPVAPPERKWNPDTRKNNLEQIEKITRRTVQRVENEQILPKSKKRAEIYEKDA